MTCGTCNGELAVATNRGFDACPHCDETRVMPTLTLTTDNNERKEIDHEQGFWNQDGASRTSRVEGRAQEGRGSEEVRELEKSRQPSSLMELHMRASSGASTPRLAPLVVEPPTESISALAACIVGTYGAVSPRLCDPDEATVVERRIGGAR